MTLKERLPVFSILLSVMLCAGRLTVTDLHALSQADARQAGPVVPQATSDAELQSAARQGDLATLRLRLRQGADPNATNALGRTPLLDAVAAGQTDAMRLLLGAPAKVNAQSPDGRTPLIEAAARGQIDVTKLLIEGGADLNAVQRGSGTALETAERSGHNDIASLLRQAGAHSSGRSDGDTVGLRAWKGDGYCGTVESHDKTAFTIRITRDPGMRERLPGKSRTAHATSGDTFTIAYTTGGQTFTQSGHF